LTGRSRLQMLVTGPGFAKEVRSRHAPKLMLEVVPKTSAPPVEPLHPFIQYNPPSDSMALPPPPVPPTAMQQPGTMREPARSDHPRDASTSPESDPLGPDPSMLAPITNAVGSALAPHASHQMSSSATLATQRPPTSMSKKGKRGDLESGDQLQRPVPRVEFGPRWCRFCEINKPDRTHHCRHCGTCVMAFDRESKRSMVADKQITASGSANVSAGEIIK
jgi:palmitoyltransferase